MTDQENLNTAPPAATRARLFALSALGLLAASVGYAGNQGYLAATDSFVAPIILSPDNDQVLATKLKASQLMVDRARTASEIEAVEETIAAGQRAIGRLKGILRTPKTALAWTSKVNARQVSAGHADRQVLVAQHAVLIDMAEKQELLVNASRKNLEAGLISQIEYAKELQTQNELRLASLENDRTRLQTDLEMEQATLARQSIAGDAPPMPELMVREEQMVRVELEIMRLESEQRSKLAEKKLLTDKLATLDEVETQLKARPMFRAAEKSMDIAFVPYTQLKGVHAGAAVYDCTWGAVNCKAVGSVTELVPGEVILPDPWGTQARGQYAVLSLQNREAAKAKILRVRFAADPNTPAPREPQDRVSAK